jgi:hypothetical protein
MQKAKRVSKSQPNTFYRGSIKIELLGSTGNQLGVTGRAGRTDWMQALQRPVVDLRPRVPLVQHCSHEPNGQKPPHARLNDDWTHQSRQITLACAKAMPWPDALLSVASQRQIISSKHPEPDFLNQTRQINSDRTHGSVRSFPLLCTPSFTLDVSVRHLWPNAGPHCATLTGCRHKVRSLRKQRSVTEK